MFISFEGGEGSGKTTIIDAIQERFMKKYNVVVTREPGGSLISEKIREVILSKEHTNMTAQTEALLYAASRTQHLDEVIIPAIKRGDLILCDRYVDSSFAYQAHARQLGFDYISKINDYAMNYLPDITFYIDVQPEIGLDRIKGRTKKDRLDDEKLEFHKMVRKGYIEVAKRFPERVVLIPGNRSINDIMEDIISYIESKLCNK